MHASVCHMICMQIKELVSANSGSAEIGKSCELLVLLYAARLANLQHMLYMLQDSRTSSQDCKKIICYMLQDSPTTFQQFASLAAYIQGCKSCQQLKSSSRVSQHIQGCKSREVVRESRSIYRAENLAKWMASFAAYNSAANLAKCKVVIKYLQYKSLPLQRWRFRCYRS